MVDFRSNPRVTTSTVLSSYHRKGNRSGVYCQFQDQISPTGPSQSETTLTLFSHDTYIAPQTDQWVVKTTTSSQLVSLAGTNIGREFL